VFEGGKQSQGSGPSGVLGVGVGLACAAEIDGPPESDARGALAGQAAARGSVLGGGRYSSPITPSAAR